MPVRLSGLPIDVAPLRRYGRWSICDLPDGGWAYLMMQDARRLLMAMVGSGACSGLRNQ